MACGATHSTSFREKKRPVTGRMAPSRSLLGSLILGLTSGARSERLGMKSGVRSAKQSFKNFTNE